MTDQALTTTRPGALAARPAFIPADDTRGSEKLGAKDVRPPLFKLAQGQTKQVKRADASYIPELREGEFFSTLSKRIYGEGPVRLIVIQSLGHQNDVLRDLKEGGGIIDRDIPDTDPRCQFTTKVIDGVNVRQKPVASTSYNYLVLIGDEQDLAAREMCIMRLKGAQLGRAKDLNMQIMGGTPTFAKAFNVTALPDKKNNFDFYSWRIDLAGWVTEAEFKAGSMLFETMADKTIEVEDDDEPEVAGEVVTGVAPEKVPF